MDYTAIKDKIKFIIENEGGLVSGKVLKEEQL